jgi:hypothetical protein
MLGSPPFFKVEKGSEKVQHRPMHSFYCTVGLVGIGTVAIVPLKQIFLSFSLLLKGTQQITVVRLSKMKKVQNQPTLLCSRVQ